VNEPSSDLAGGRSWPFSVSLAAALSVASPWLLHLFDGKKPIEEFAGRAVGRVVLEGLDVSGYAHNYVMLWALTVGLFLAGSALLVWLRRHMVRFAGPGTLTPEFRGLARLSELAVVFVVFALATRDLRALALEGLLVRALLLLSAFVVVRVAVERFAVGSPAFDRVLRRVLGDSDFLVALLFAPTPFLFAAYLALDWPLHFRDKALAVWLVVYALLAAGFVLWMAHRTRHLDDGEAAARVGAAERKFALALVPLSAFPLMFPVGQEIQALARGLAPETVVWWLGALLVVASAAAVWLQRRRAQRRGREAPAVRKLLVYAFFPLLVVTVAAVSNHYPALDLGELDYFHQGEKVLPVHQLFEYGSVPQVDLRLSHSFSDATWGTLYALVSGDHQGMGGLLWDRWLPHLLALLVLYLVLARTIGPTFSLLACCLLPLVTIAPAYYAPALVPALCLTWAVEQPSWRRWLVVWIASAGLFLWRIDFGLAGGVGLAVAVATFLLHAPRSDWRAVGRSLAAFAAAALALLVVLSLTAGSSLFEALGRLFGSYTGRLVTRTRAYIIHRFDLAALLQYYLLPAVAALHLGYLVLRRWLNPRRLAPHHFLLLYTAAFSLVISLRSTERHSLSEFFNPYIFVLLLALVPVMLLAAPPRERTWVRVGFLAAVTAAVLFVLPPAKYQRSPHHTFRLADNRPLFELRHWQPGEKRVGWVESRHQPFVELLDRSLGPGQTFYDFTNSPLLYALADREYPIWVIPNLIQTGERMQAEVIAELDRWREDDRLPLVLFKQGHRFWDTADGVPNEIRSYRIAEWIYRHYTPWQRAGDYEVWRVRDAAVVSEAGVPESWRLPPAPGEPVVHDLRVTGAEEIGWRFATWGTDPRISGFADLSALPDLDRLRGAWLRIGYRTTRDGFLEVRYATDGRTFDGLHMKQLHVLETPGERSRTLFVPLLVADQAQRWTGLRFDPPRDVTFEVTSLDVVHQPFEPLTSPAQIEQFFDLVRLPEVWAEHDPYDAATETAVLATLQAEPVLVEPGEPLVWAVDPGLDRSAGNYLHLQLRPQPEDSAGGRQPVRLEVRHGPNLVDGFKFQMPRERVHTLPADGAPRLDGVERLALPARRVYEAVGSTGWMDGYFRLDDLPSIATDAEARLRIHYRARGGGTPVGVAFGFGGNAARDGEVVGELTVGGTADTDAGNTAWVALPAAESVRRLTAISFALPAGSFFEPLSAELVTTRPSHHLVRLSTQWKWSAVPPEKIDLWTDAPILVEKAWLRAGD